MQLVKADRSAAETGGAPVGRNLRQYSVYGDLHMNKLKKIRSPVQLQALFYAYMERCAQEELMPNAAGFFVWLHRDRGIGMDRESYRALGNEARYAGVLRRIDDALEDAVLNCRTQKESIKTAYLNARCGYRADREDGPLTVRVVIGGLDAGEETPEREKRGKSGKARKEQNEA